MDIEQNSESIKSIFQEGYTTKTNIPFEELKRTFEAIKSPHSMVFFEGLSVRFAIDSIHKTGDLSLWTSFNRFFSLKFAKQTHIGLGWAFGELGLNPIDYFEEINDKWKSKEWNGYGYFTGTLKRRSVLRALSFSETIPKEFLSDFIQGFGRSLWYSYKGNLEQITKAISAFDPKHQDDLWNGLGVAIAFVGGLSKDEWEGFKKISSIHSLKKGFKLASPSLKDKDTLCFLEDFLN